MYGGGPIIVREDLDIYARDIAHELGDKRGKNKSATRAAGMNPNIFANNQKN